MNLAEVREQAMNIEMLSALDFIEKTISDQLYFKLIYNMSKIIIAAGPVIVEGDKVLLVKHGKDNFWKFCGGKAEDHETDLKAVAIREAKEEMGLQIEISADAPYFFYTEKEVDGVNVSVILVHFLARRNGEIIPGQDIGDWRWLDISDLDENNLAPNIKPTLMYFGFYSNKE